MRIVWDKQAWRDYLWWQEHDRKVLMRINKLIEDIARHGNEGLGKPELLRQDLAGYWSRRITSEHRIVYLALDNEVRILSCRYHYGE